MKRAIALGTFDGVHIGHRAIINAAIDKAAELDMEPMIYTFTAHPMALFGKQPPLVIINFASITFEHHANIALYAR